jgi:hypothetical protein
VEGKQKVPLTPDRRFTLTNGSNQEAGISSTQRAEKGGRDRRREGRGGGAYQTSKFYLQTWHGRNLLVSENS